MSQQKCAILNDLFQYFESYMFFIPEEDKNAFQNREAFIEKLNTDSCFAEVWNYFKKICPDAEYFVQCLENNEQPFYFGDYEWEYKRYLAQTAFDKLSKEELETLQDEVNQMKLNAYQNALEEEASRLNCHVSEIRPVCPILPLKPGNDMESKFPDLPQNIFINIMKRLEIVDVFRLTLVCKKWKDAVYSNPKELKKAEYAFTTHMITFTDWMDPSSNKDWIKIKIEYERFSQPLIKWYCELSQNLETLILKDNPSYSSLAHLLKSGSTIKNLQIDDYSRIKELEVRWLNTDLYLPNLEVFWSTPSCSECILRLKQTILTTSSSLKALSTHLETEEIELIKKTPSAQNIFRNLIALETKCYTSEVLELLLKVENLQLRYLGLFCYQEQYYKAMTRPFARSLLDQVLLKLTKLEILILSCSPGITNKTIELMSKLPLNLKFAILYEPGSLKEDEEVHFEIKTLIDFSDALRSRCPNLDLTEIHFLMECDEEQLCAFQEVGTGFTFATTRNDSYEKYAKYNFYHPKIKEMLSLSF